MKNWLFVLSFILTGYVSAQNQNVTPLDIGSEAPQFELPATDGQSYGLEDFKEYPILVVIFTCNHCPTAQAYEDRIIQMVDEYRPKGVGFVAISPNDPDAISLSELGYTDLSDDLDEMKIRSNAKNFNFPYLYDGEDQKVSIAYGPSATPQVFVFDEERKLRYRGRIDDMENPYKVPNSRDLKVTLDAMLRGDTVAVPTTKTFGCSTKWSWKGDWIAKQREEWANESVTLQDITLEEVSSLMKNSGDKLQLINLWATWCGPCLVEFPELVDIYRMYRNRDFEFISLSTDKISQKANVLDQLKRFEASNQNYIYTGDDIYQLIEAIDPEWQGALPYTVLLAPGGKIIYKVQGLLDAYKLKHAIISFLGRYYANDKR